MTPDPELCLLDEAAAARGIDAAGLRITRTGVSTSGGWVSALRYGPAEADPEVVYVHGGGLDAHTWDLVAAAWRRPAVAVDLPGHGHSDRPAGGGHGPRALGLTLREALATLVPSPRLVVGMSLGGMAALGVSAGDTCPLVLVDVCPGSRVPSDSTVHAVMGNPPAPFEQFTEAVAARAGRPVSAGLRHSVWHATRALGDGTRAWRTVPGFDPGSFADLWPDLEAQAHRVTAVLAESGSFVTHHDRRRLSELLGPRRVLQIPGAGHSVQTSRPRELAGVLAGL